ncbi:MAG TPA: 16S rRNA (cytidine(1402)-2'-O)-methyltransferase [Porticoccaceae bacterium]|nr:16S rRNA (cytidine(1402)-2'-O)-methyltransferase [Porticoccaceae bacterium]HCO60394.1 16S rRNA (cytidine(1402)-2'-O)-methyltransferase [Porticoccaceae bacterium]
MAGTLYVVATPIGNLRDMVPRALEILQTVDLIAAEDTRRSGQLLRHFNISSPLISYHDHSDESKVRKVLEALARDEQVALISDAGTPLISDPGYRLVREAQAMGAIVSPVPGACAAMAALSVAGLASDRFVFEGFLPAKQNQRRAALEALDREPRTLIFYEAPHRIQAMLSDLSEVLGSAREVVLARELTKTYETVIKTSVGALLERVTEDTDQQRGELVLVVQGCADSSVSADSQEQTRVLSVLLEDLSVKQAANLAAKITGGSRNRLYQQALQMKNDA